MKPPQVVLHADERELVIGPISRVVGTLSALPDEFPGATGQLLCDIVEVRLDEISDRRNWVDRCRSIEASGLPVILTIRLKSEGGKWTSSDTDRLPLFQHALGAISCVDIEYKSALMPSVSKLAKKAGKQCIVSYHDFNQTPKIEALEEIITKAQRFASIVKLSTMVSNEADVKTLAKLVQKNWQVPVCVIGMGPLGTQTRISFATMGSCMTYGYLDKPSAPGQLSASKLVETLRGILPNYNEDYVCRKQVLEFA